MTSVILTHRMLPLSYTMITCAFAVLAHNISFFEALLVLAVAANAHWTHDESLAAEIGAPPGKTMPGGAVNFIAEEAKATGTNFLK